MSKKKVAESVLGLLQRQQPHSSKFTSTDSTLLDNVVPSVQSVRKETEQNTQEATAEVVQMQTVTPIEVPAQTKTPPSIVAQTNEPTIQHEWQKAPTLDILYSHIHTCMNCSLGATRLRFVFGVGNPNAKLLVIGEAPGEEEDKQGEPFVGRAGQLLTKMLEAINFTREEIYIANILKCRPPKNRRPTSEEVTECEPYLWKQIELLQPVLILALGLTAAETLFKQKVTMKDIRGNIQYYKKIPTIITYHPAALLRNPEWKKPAWEDIQLVMKTYNSLIETTNPEWKKTIKQ